MKPDNKSFIGLAAIILLSIAASLYLIGLSFEQNKIAGVVLVSILLVGQVVGGPIMIRRLWKQRFKNNDS